MVLLLLFRVIGVIPSLAGVGVTLAMIPISSVIGRYMSTVRGKLMKATDERVKITTEVRSSCMHAWLAHAKRGAAVGLLEAPRAAVIAASGRYGITVCVKLTKGTDMRCEVTEVVC